jgi:5-methylphenazine-1-carboxylate 1-monooxygenase
VQELEDIAANYKRVTGFQVEGLNTKPPIVQMQARLDDPSLRAKRSNP